MRVIRAETMGMCFGVKAAIAAAQAEARPSDVTIRGELVHNPAVLDDLSRRGFAQRPEARRDEPIDTEGVLITAHGVSDRRLSALRDSGKRIVDTTCPLVRSVHAAAQHLAADGRLVIVVGKPGHVEVEGVVEDLTRAVVVPCADDVVDYGEPTLGVVSQSTTPPERFAATVAAIRERNPSANVRVADTICAPTRDRQRAALDLLGRVDAVVVVGGESSNNCRALVELAESRGIPARLVSTPDALDRAWASRFAVVGLTAGTSTRDEEIDAVHRALIEVGAPT